MEIERGNKISIIYYFINIKNKKSHGYILIKIANY